MVRGVVEVAKNVGLEGILLGLAEAGELDVLPAETGTQLTEGRNKHDGWDKKQGTVCSLRDEKRSGYIVLVLLIF